ncbi:MAG: acetolactate synthase catalytic subunit [Burkholderiaceae bacterium]|nr:acetolactate synthase catalytic subunit [Burkholderiaceae bacterium]
MAHRLAKALARHGVTHIFGQSLPSMVILAGEHYGIEQIAYRQENTGGYMADGYARASGKVAVLTAQNGPAATLLVAPLAEALKASIPIVALVQDVARDQTDRNAFQELDHESMFRPVSKWVRRVTSAHRIEDYVDMAFVAAASGRAGPAVLLLPADLLTESAPDQFKFVTDRKASLGRYPLDRMAPAQDKIRELAQMIAQASNPVVIAGGGLHASGACSELAQLQQVAHLPVATTVMGKGSVDETHPLSIGVASYFMGRNGSTRHLGYLIAEADLIVLIGTRTNQNGTDSWKLYPKSARFVHIDIDPQEIGRNYEAIRLVGDAKLVLGELLNALGSVDLTKRAQARLALENKIKHGKAEFKAEASDLTSSDQAPIRPERVMSDLDALLTPDAMVVADASYSSIWVANYLTAQRAGMRFVTPRGLAGLGWGLPMALGVYFANPGSPVFCVVGDGGFAHAWAELETAVRKKARIVLIVLNNGILAYQKHAENIKFGDHTNACDFVPVDHTLIAKAVGANGIRVDQPDKLRDAIQTAVRFDGVTLIDVVTDPDAFPPVTWYEG